MVYVHHGQQPQRRGAARLAAQRQLWLLEVLLSLLMLLLQLPLLLRVACVAVGLLLSAWPPLLTVILLLLLLLVALLLILFAQPFLAMLRLPLPLLPLRLLLQRLLPEEVLQVGGEQLLPDLPLGLLHVQAQLPLLLRLKARLVLLRPEGRLRVCPPGWLGSLRGQAPADGLVLLRHPRLRLLLLAAGAPGAAGAAAPAGAAPGSLSGGRLLLRRRLQGLARGLRSRRGVFTSQLDPLLDT